MIKELTKLANHLDAKGLRREADYLDAVIRKIAEVDEEEQSVLDRLRSMFSKRDPPHSANNNGAPLLAEMANGKYVEPEILANNRQALKDAFTKALYSIHKEYKITETEGGYQVYDSPQSASNISPEAIMKDFVAVNIEWDEKQTSYGAGWPSYLVQIGVKNPDGTILLDDWYSFDVIGEGMGHGETTRIEGVGRNDLYVWGESGASSPKEPETSLETNIEYVDTRGLDGTPTRTPKSVFDKIDKDRAESAPTTQPYEATDLDDFDF